jgi:hypothetical protein
MVKMNLSMNDFGGCEVENYIHATSPESELIETGKILLLVVKKIPVKYSKINYLAKNHVEYIT